MRWKLFWKRTAPGRLEARQASYLLVLERTAEREWRGTAVPPKRGKAADRRPRTNRFNQRQEAARWLLIEARTGEAAERCDHVFARLRAFEIADNDALQKAGGSR